MATAICLQCGSPKHWRAQRGRRLADLRCACGGSLRPASWKDGSWIAVAHDSTHKGQRYHTCGVCQRRTLHVRVATIAFRVLFADRTFPAGTAVCRRHEDALPLDHPYWSLRDAPVTRALLTAWIDEVEAWMAHEASMVHGRPPAETIESWAWQESVPGWLRSELAKSADADLVSLRNTIVDHVLRARGAMIQPGDCQRIFEEC